MHILVITGSPHKRGTSALLVDAFLEGATAAGHQVERFDSAFAAVAPCKACDFCRSHGEQCTQKRRYGGPVAQAAASGSGGLGHAPLLFWLQRPA